MLKKVANGIFTLVALFGCVGGVLAAILFVQHIVAKNYDLAGPALIFTAVFLLVGWGAASQTQQMRPGSDKPDEDFMRENDE